MVLPFYMIYLELHVVGSSNHSTDFFSFDSTEELVTACLMFSYVMLSVFTNALLLLFMPDAFLTHAERQRGH